MVWCPSFQSRVPAEGVREYRVGHELVDAFLEFASGRARPNTVRAYAHDLKVFFSIVAKDPVEVTPADVMRLRDRPAAPAAGRRERGADFPDARLGAVTGDGHASPGGRLRPSMATAHPGDTGS